ncbi:MAG: outer membrane protein assembly factor BamB family protein [Planctomycetota bacterium]|jgi:outer membrane protein assembly factor BamB
MMGSTSVIRVASGWAPAITLITALAARGAEGPSAPARQILDATGVQGGLVVHLGCGDGQLTAALRAGDSFLVHGLDRDAANVEKARATIRAAGVYGPVSVDHLAGRLLPYTDNLVNLLVGEDLGNVPMDEVLRVLAPNGVAYVERGGKWITTVKPWPQEIDEWTHYLHNPNGNAVSRDRAVDFLRQMQWIGGPRYSRHHDHMSAASAMVTAGGRLFSIFDHTSPFSIQLPSKWQLVARDAFNGAILWRREMGPWFSQLQRLKSGPSDLPRRLVAMGDTVFVTLALDAPVTALDAATGETRTTYQQTKGTDEILCSDGVLFLVVNREGYSRGPLTEWTEQKRVLMAVSVDTGERLWKKEWPWVVPGCLAVDGARVVFFDGERVVALDRKTGNELWQSEALGRRSPVPIYFSPCLVLHEDLVLFSGADPETEPYHADNGKTMYAFSADTGKTLWKAPHAPSGYRSAEDILVIDGLVWTSDIFNSRELRSEQTGMVWGRDLRTGEVKVEFMPDVDTHWFHHRCHRAKATEKYLLTSRTGIEFVDFRKGHWTCHHWVRGACLYGIMPGNGMVYSPPHPCACYLEAKLYGFNALAPHSASRQKIIDAAEQAERLQRGPAYDEPVEAGAIAKSDWPTLRADVARSGRVAAEVPAELSTAWRAEIGGRLSSPVVAGGRLFVAAIDAHEVHALDAAAGEPLWRFTTGARVDSPPTIWKGRVLFGSADGHVYCLRADDGRLIWRYRAAPADLRMGAFGQIESVWPVHGSVLVCQDEQGRAELWCVAGRSMFVDGGLRLVRLNPATGAKIGERVLDDRVPGTDDNLQVALSGLNMPVALSDVLVCDGKYVYMKSQQFDAEGNRIDIDVPNRSEREQRGETAHLFCPTGLLDDVWWHRSYWVYGRVWKSGAGGYYRAGRFAVSGRPMVFDDRQVYSFGRKPQYYRWTTPMEYMLYAAAKQPEPARLGGQRKSGKKQPAKKRASLGSKPPNTIQTVWNQDVPILVRAMVLADKTLFLAGPPDLIDEPKTLDTFETPETQQLLARQATAIEGSEGALLWAVSAADGRKLAERKLEAMPVFDGMIAAGNRIYYATTDGRVIALAGKT